MSLRPVQLTESGSGDRRRIRHVIGIDESGDPNGSSSPFVMAAVQCSRTHGERLAEVLIECGLRPWRAKASSLYGLLDDPSEQDDRVEEFIEALREEPISWSAAAGWNEYSTRMRAAVASTIGSRTITTPHQEEDIDIEGDATILPDGDMQTYGGSQHHLRIQCGSRFNSSFQSSYCSVFVSGLEKADYTYPEAIAADYIAGYVRKKLNSGVASVETLPQQVSRISSDWEQPDLAPLPLYHVRTSGARDPELNRARIIAWIEGRRPPADPDLTSGSQFENIVSRLSSEEVQQYLLEFV